MADGFQCRLFQTADLCLGDVNLLGDFHLCLPLVKAEAQDEVLALVQMIHASFRESSSIQLSSRFFFVTDLVHDVEGVSSVGIRPGIVEADRALDGIQGRRRSPPG